MPYTGKWINNSFIINCIFQNKHNNSERMKTVSKPVISKKKGIAKV